ncbi:MULTISPECIES: hypothetical protein [unclassified Streptomyces]|uniref:hypothetical protein n=1 Tax=unclassified Streptomyces TaxID=2593676 RepID=UPI0024414972|nr:hypothetical protein [Streptomyces sp. DH41]MDG9723088.1 hypothetical protein [Streptomyces sp. DH41]
MVIGLGVSAACAIGALIALVSVVAVALPGRPEPWPVHLMRRAAGTAAAAAAAVYSLGFTAVLVSASEADGGANSSPTSACRESLSPEPGSELSHHRHSYLPLRFDCVLEDGTTYSSDPDYVWMNWTALPLAASAVLLAVGAAPVAGRLSRAERGGLPPRPAGCG